VEAIVGEEKPLPLLYVKAELCRLFHCLPSELEQESAELLKMVKMLNIADKLAMEQTKGVK
jgi:hypothetical protein